MTETTTALVSVDNHSRFMSEINYICDFLGFVKNHNDVKTKDLYYHIVLSSINSVRYYNDRLKMGLLQ